MAAMLFTVAGTAVAGPIGGFIGNVLGNMVDQALFPQPKPPSRIQVSTYGTVIPVCYGGGTRIAGNVIFWSGLHNATKSQKAAAGPKGLLSGAIGLLAGSTKSPQYTDVAVALCEGPILGVRDIWANGKPIFSNGGVLRHTYTKGDSFISSTAGFETLTVYVGDYEQGPDPTIESHVSSDIVSAYHGIAYCVLTGFNLAQFGNVLPNLEFLVEAQSSIGVGQILSDLASRAGIDPNTVSTSGLEFETCLGYTIGQSSTATAAANTLGTVFNFDGADQGGSLRFVPRGLCSRGQIFTNDLCGQAPGEARPEPLHWTRDRETLLPQQCALIYSDPANVYNPSSAMTTRASGSADANIQIQVAITLDTITGQAVCDKILWNAWNGRDRVKGYVTDRWIKGLQAGYIYTLETPGGYEPFRMLTVARGANAVIEFEATRDVPLVYTSPNPGNRVGTYNPAVVVVGPTSFALLDMPIVQDADDSTGFYFAVNGIDAGWSGAQVERSTDGGSTYSLVSLMGLSSTIGSVPSALPSGPAWLWDRINRITVNVDSPANDMFASASELDVLNGANGIWLGAPGETGEIIQFATAVQYDENTWELSDLLRGRLGTEWAIGGHGDNEMLVQLIPYGLQRTDFGAGDWNKVRDYISPTLGMDNSETPQAFTNTGEGKMCYAPVHPAGSRDGSNDLTLTWFRRSRYLQPGLGNGLLPLGESAELYSIDIIVSGHVVGTFAATGPFSPPVLPNLVLSAAQQTAMGITPGDPVSGNIFQISDVRGRGHPLAFTVEELEHG